MNYQYILFDLDGTLTDPMIGITKSVRYALKHYGIDVQDLNELCPFIGPPLKDSFIEYYDFTQKDALDAVHKYREYFSDQGKFENKVYEGIPELLKELKRAGKYLMVATSKPEVFAKQILEHFSIASYFDFIGGGLLDGSREEKGDVIRYVLESNRHLFSDSKAEELASYDLSKVVMVGDRKYDVIGAKELDLASIGVLYGYGNEDELVHAGADYLVGSVKELSKLLIYGEK